mmetsp:Transcript_42092/g.135342  ORF Transcript_42092/g.135342 Transcript_42092/m.135342 type:complete len:292 (+) Transcript_42092:1818-2693(+)
MHLPIGWSSRQPCPASSSGRRNEFASARRATKSVDGETGSPSRKRAPVSGWTTPAPLARFPTTFITLRRLASDTFGESHSSISHSHSSAALSEASCAAVSAGAALPPRPFAAAGLRRDCRLSRSASASARSSERSAERAAAGGGRVAIREEARRFSNASCSRAARSAASCAARSARAASSSGLGGGRRVREGPSSPSAASAAWFWAMLRSRSSSYADLDSPSGAAAGSTFGAGSGAGGDASDWRRRLRPVAGSATALRAGCSFAAEPGACHESSPAASCSASRVGTLSPSS